MARSRRPSPSINEALIARHFPVDPLTRQQVHDIVLGDLHDAMAATRHAVEKAFRVADATMGNELLTLAARHKRAKDEVWRSIEPALRRIDEARAKANRAVEQLMAAVSGPGRPNDAAGMMLASEVRARLAAMRPADRQKAITTAVEQGDEVVVGAVLSAPPMLSGLDTPAAVAMVRTRWQGLHHAAEMDRLSRIGRAVEDLDRAGTLAMSYPNLLTDGEAVARAEASEQAMNEAIASS